MRDRLMQIAALGAATSPLAVGAACGGSVVFDGEAGKGGGGGIGGGTGVTSVTGVTGVTTGITTGVTSSVVAGPSSVSSGTMRLRKSPASRDVIRDQPIALIPIPTATPPCVTVRNARLVGP